MCNISVVLMTGFSHRLPDSDLLCGKQDFNKKPTSQKSEEQTCDESGNFSTTTN